MDSSLKRKTGFHLLEINRKRKQEIEKKCFTEIEVVCYTNGVVYTVTQKSDTPPAS